MTLETFLTYFPFLTRYNVFLIFQTLIGWLQLIHIVKQIGALNQVGTYRFSTDFVTEVKDYFLQDAIFLIDSYCTKLNCSTLFQNHSILHLELQKLNEHKIICIEIVSLQSFFDYYLLKAKFQKLIAKLRLPEQFIRVPKYLLVSHYNILEVSKNFLFQPANNLLKLLLLIVGMCQHGQMNKNYKLIMFLWTYNIMTSVNGARWEMPASGFK
ncbi:Hypothetical_protein [Hexamita inflata]|uniref:Hypothetical_protein n=1 Tax=Hexamita inflata TaxID=28002 RepID=A0ABP1GRY8_9EUKA